MSDRMFDFNRDGKLDNFEKAAQTQFIEENVINTPEKFSTFNRNSSSNNYNSKGSKVGYVIGCLIMCLGAMFLDMGMIFGLLLIIIGVICMFC